MSRVVARSPIHYPDSDGQPIAENTIQFRWILRIKWNLDVVLRHLLNCFVAGAHLIYAVRDRVKIRVAPEAYVAFGPPKKDRGSYKVWEEGNVFPQVVFEVWSPGNDGPALKKKMKFYAKYGAEEYYFIHPEIPERTAGSIRVDGKFQQIEKLDGWVSPRLGVRFAMGQEEWELYRPDGTKFLDPAEVEEKLTTEVDRLKALLRVHGIKPELS